MSDYKTQYSQGVDYQKELSSYDKELMGKIDGGFTRKNTYSKYWQEVDINEIVQRFAPGAVPVHKKGKIYFYSKDGRYAVVADVSGYLRIAFRQIKDNKERLIYLNRFGEEVTLLTLPNGRRIQRSIAERMMLTHFLIKKRKKN